MRGGESSEIAFASSPSSEFVWDSTKSPMILRGRWDASRRLKQLYKEEGGTEPDGDTRGRSGGGADRGAAGISRGDRVSEKELAPLAQFPPSPVTEKGVLEDYTSLPTS